MSGVLGMNYLRSLLLFAINPVLHILEVRTLEYFGCIIAVESCNNSEKIFQDLFVLYPPTFAVILRRTREVHLQPTCHLFWGDQIYWSFDSKT